MMNNYFAVGPDVYPFEDSDRAAARAAYETAAQESETSSYRVRIYRAHTPYLREMCNRVVGESR